MKMRKFGIFVVLLSLLVSMVAGCQPRFQPGTYSDDMGRAVSINEIPERIVSHVPPITETLFALGLGEKVVGVSDYCDYPEEAKLKPSVGNYYNPSIENIVALDPDLVLTDGHSEGIKQLDSLGIKYLVIDPKDIDGIFKDIELLGKVSLGKRINHLPRGLSGGEKQRVAIARALITAPKILFADEPTGNLDTKSSEEIFSLLADLNKKEGLTVLLTTHNPKLGSLAGRIVYLKDGRIVSKEESSLYA